MRRLNSVFGLAPELKTLAARAGEILALQKNWEAIAPPPLNQHSHVGPLNQGQLTVYTSSAGVASKLKMQLNGLLEKLQNQGVKVTSIRVEVQVSSPSRAKPRVVRTLSSNTRRRLRDFAENLPDSPLRHAVARLAEKPMK
jgi:hypothetical protein